MFGQGVAELIVKLCQLLEKTGQSASQQPEEQQSVVEVPLLAAFLLEAPALGDWRPCVPAVYPRLKERKARIHVFDQARSGAAHNDLSTAVKPQFALSVCTMRVGVVLRPGGCREVGRDVC